MELNNDLEILVELIPVVSLQKNNYIIKLPDSAYGEWLIYKSNAPLYYLNIFDPQYKVIKDRIDSSEISIAQIVDEINKKMKVNYSLKSEYSGILNYKKKEIKKILIQKFPFSFLKFVD